MIVDRAPSAGITRIRLCGSRTGSPPLSLETPGSPRYSVIYSEYMLLNKVCQEKEEAGLFKQPDYGLASLVERFSQKLPGDKLAQFRF